jgi:opacity protein-like surface antigen
MRLDGKDLVQQIDLDPENAGGNKTIVATLKTDSWELPLYFRVGIAYDVLRNEYMTLTTAIDAVRPNDNNEHLNIGAEFGFRNILFVRGGYKALFLEDSEEGLTAGLGLQYPLFGTIGTRIDYSYQDFGRLKEVHSITLGVEF